MFSTDRFAPFLHNIELPSTLPTLYIVSHQQGEPTYGDFTLVCNGGDIYFTDEGHVWGMCGLCVIHQQSGTPQIVEGGVMIDDVLLNYTYHMYLETAVLRIQRTWRKRRASNAANRIAAAFRLWCIRKNELWNPHTFVGVAHLVIETMRGMKEDAIATM